MTSQEWTYNARHGRSAATQARHALARVAAPDPVHGFGHTGKVLEGPHPLGPLPWSHYGLHTTDSGLSVVTVEWDDGLITEEATSDLS